MATYLINITLSKISQMKNVKYTFKILSTLHKHIQYN